MPTITSIKPQKYKNDWINIFLDGKFSFSLPLDLFVKEKISSGQEISEEKVNSLVKEGEFSLILDKILKFLSFRPRSSEEINKYLDKKGVGEQTKKAVIKKLIDQKLIDDEAFARWWTGQRQKFRFQGERLIKTELKFKGIDNEIINKVLNENKDETALAQELALLKLKRFKGQPVLEKKKKLYRILTNRGYNWETVQSVVDKILKKE